MDTSSKTHTSRKKKEDASNLLLAARRSTIKARELTTASLAVVHRRMAMARSAMLYPSTANHDEFALMVPEKMAAFTEAGSILMDRFALVGQDIAAVFTGSVKLSTDATTAVMEDLNLPQFMMAQAVASASWAADWSRLPNALYLLAMEMQDAVIAPIHRAATGNSERLRMTAG